MALTDAERRRVRFLTDYYSQPVPPEEAPAAAPAVTTRSARAPAAGPSEPTIEAEVEEPVIVVDQPDDDELDEDDEETS